MAEVPPGPSSLLASPPGDAAEEEEEEEEEEGGGRPYEEDEEEAAAVATNEDGREGPPSRHRRPPHDHHHHRRPCPPPHRRNHQLNGLIAGPELRHFRGSLKGKALSHSGGSLGGHETSPPASSAGQTMGHGQQEPPAHPQQEGGRQEPTPPPPSLGGGGGGNHHRLPHAQARTAQPQQPHRHHRRHHHDASSTPSAGDRNGLAGEGGEEEEEEEEEEGEEEPLLLLSRSLASTCSLQKCPSMGTSTDSPHVEEGKGDLVIQYVRYESELQMPNIMRLITKDLSEPYSIYTYRYFIHNWPQLCFLAMVGDECVGAIVCKLDMHKKMFRRGYIAMLAVDSKYRRKGIGTNLVKKAIYAMVEGDCDEVVLETEITNKSALKLYENLGFVRDKRLFRYYLNGVDALRLKLWLR